ncbi:biopolymer transporter ExbD [bacterium]|nr:biopolymer transporter ExbD [candidate division CSSED10-310 bacterium]
MPMNPPPKDEDRRRRSRIPPLGTGLTEINLTPFVDVAFVLLIIFMVTAPMLKQGLDIALPQASERLFPEETESRYILSMDSEGLLYLDNRRIPFEHLELRLRQLNESTRIEALFLEADRNLPYGDVIAVMDVVKKSGIKTLGMVTKPKTIEAKE